MSLDTVANITITANTQTPSQRGFGTPLIMAYHTVRPSQRVLTYTSLASMVTDGFSVYSGAYLAAVKIKAQNPSPPAWKIGRRATPYVQQVTFDVVSTEEGSARGFTVRHPTTGVETAISYTVPAGATGGSIAHAIADLLCSDGPTGPTGPVGPTGIGGATGPYGVVANSVGAKVTITTTGGGTGPAAGLLADISHWDEGLSLTNITLDSGIAADIAACAAEDPDFYGICLDSNGAAEVRAAAATCETMLCLLAVDTSDSGCFGTGTSDVGSLLKASAYARTVPFFNGRRLLHYSGAAALGVCLPQVPGSWSLCHKQLRGVEQDSFTARSSLAQARLKLRSLNTYYAIGGIGDVLFGTSASGEFADNTVFLDWVRVRMQERMVFALQAVRKNPYTDVGIASITNEVYAVLNAGVAAGGFTPGTPSVTAPKAAAVSPVDKANRLLPDVAFTAQLAGAIHTINVTGTVKV